MDPIANLGAEHVIDKPVLCDPAEPRKRGRGDDRVEVVPVAGDLGAGPGIPASIRSFSSSGVADMPLKRSDVLSLY